MVSKGEIMSLTRQERDRMIGKRFHSNMNDPDEFAVTVLDVRRASHGFTVVIQEGKGMPKYIGLSVFNRLYPHEVRS